MMKRFILFVAVTVLMLPLFTHPASAAKTNRGIALRQKLVAGSVKAAGEYRALIIGINDEHRFIYKPQSNTLLIAQLRFHY